MELSIKETYLWLNSMGFSNKEIGKIEDYCRDIRDISSNNIDENLKKILSKSSIEKIAKYNSRDFIKMQLEKLEKLNIKYLCYRDEEFPQRLLEIEDSPKSLYIRGEILPEDEVSIAIVGARKHTEYGKWACKYFVEELAKLGVTIISGLAYGIDAIAHKIALENGARTIAVLGNGVDVVYPINNSGIYMKAINKGAVVSEYAMGSKSLPYRFPERNRIISGLSKGVVVIEAKEHSGSLITGRVAAEQGREVFAVPGNINSLYSKGTNALIRDGATPLLDIDDILINISEIKKNISVQEEYSISLEGNELEVYNLMVSGVLNTDNICEKLKRDISYINGILTSLEIKGYIENIRADDYIITE